MSKDSFFLKDEYGLKTDVVFKSRSATEDDLELWVDRDEELKKWGKVLEDSKKTPNSNFLVFIIGDYGIGKTLSLLKIKEEADKMKMGMYPIYLNFKSEEKVTKPGLDFLQRIFKEINFEGLRVSAKEIETLQEIYPDVGNVFQNIVGQKQTKLLFGKRWIANREKLAIAFIRGEITPNQSQLRDLGVVRKISSIDIAKEYLIGILYLLKASGFSTLVVAVDEFEYLFSIVTKSQQSIYLAVLRELYDLQVNIPKKLRNMMTNMVFFIATSRAGWTHLEDLEKKETSIGGPIVPLKRRVTDKISLEGLSKQDSRKLIERRLSFNRIRGKYENKPLIPYTEDFVDYIFKLTGGAPGDIIKRCDHILDMGLERRVPRLSAEFAKEVFKERGLSF